MTTRARERCHCRRVLLAPGVEPLSEQVGVRPSGPRSWVHGLTACGPVTALLPKGSPAREEDR